jgi:hypothetical protein
MTCLQHSPILQRDRLECIADIPFWGVSATQVEHGKEGQKETLLGPKTLVYKYVHTISRSLNSIGQGYTADHSCRS